MEQPTPYADSAGVSIAYQVHGDGPVELVFVPGFVSHVAVSGSADHIGPGEFGIPEDAYQQIESGLFADRAEMVPF